MKKYLQLIAHAKPQNEGNDKTHTRSTKIGLRPYYNYETPKFGSDFSFWKILIKNFEIGQLIKQRGHKINIFLLFKKIKSV